MPRKNITTNFAGRVFCLCRPAQIEQANINMQKTGAIVDFFSPAR